MSKFPKQQDVTSFYRKLELGRDGRPTTRWEAHFLIGANLPYKMRLSWQPDALISRVTCHRQVAKSLTECLGKVRDSYPSLEALSDAGMDLFGGCYNFATDATGEGLSMHSYGIAIDIDPANNPPGKKHTVGDGMMPQAVVDIFENAGWSWGGRWKRPECAHFQATA